MDNDAVLMKLGELSGKLDGMGREIGDIKDMIGNNEKGLCGRLSTLEVHGARISQENAADIVILRDKVNHIDNELASSELVETAKKHWIDSSYAKVGAVITLALAIFGAVKSFL